MRTRSHMAAWFEPAHPSTGLVAPNERTPAADAGPRAEETPRPPSRAWLPRLRNPQTWRLASGLVLFAFVLTHFLNHALGHVSLETMQQGQGLRRAVWGSWSGTLLLYGAAAVHVGLALWKLIRRHTWRMPTWEAAQIALGLWIPFLAVAHVMTTRGLSAFYGVEPTYALELRLLWPARDDAIPFAPGRVAARHGRPAPLAADQALVWGVEPRSARPRPAGSPPGANRLDRGRAPGRPDVLCGAAALRCPAGRQGPSDRSG